MMQAHLRMPKEMALEEKEAYVDAIIKRLGLAKAANTVVGDAKTRGLSGGCHTHVHGAGRDVPGPARADRRVGQGWGLGADRWCRCLCCYGRTCAATVLLCLRITWPSCSTGTLSPHQAPPHPP